VDALGEGGREQDVGRATFECAAEDRPLGANGIQDRRQIRDAGLEIGEVDIATRSSRSATVVQDQARKRREAMKPLRGRSVLPDGVDVAQPIELPDDVDRAVADGLISDVGAVRGPRVRGLRGLHVRPPDRGQASATLAASTTQNTSRSRVISASLQHLRPPHVQGDFVEHEATLDIAAASFRPTVAVNGGDPSREGLDI
jgi:hypothetical protein